jgi:uncharacterized protein YndB with AHSA1/START domain
MEPMIEVPSSPDVAVLVGDFLGHTPESLFAWLTEPEKLTKWWPERAEVDLRVGGKYRLLWPKPEWTIRGEYTSVEAPRHLGFTWQGDPDDSLRSQVVIWIDPIEEGSRLAIWHSGYADATERRQLCEGWIHFGMRLMGIAEP